MAKTPFPQSPFEAFYEESTRVAKVHTHLLDEPEVGAIRKIDSAQSEESESSVDSLHVFEHERIQAIQGPDAPWSIDSLVRTVNLSEEEVAEYNGRIRFEGLDCLAFFKSRRHQARGPFRGYWGVFFVDRGLRFLGDLLWDAVPAVAAGKEWRDRQQASTNPLRSPYVWALDFLRAHELFHFRFDVYALCAEVIARTAMYEQLRHAFRRYPFLNVEEALANAAASDWARRKGNVVPGCARFAREFMLLQPGAYSRFEEPLGELRAELAANLLDLDLRDTARRHDQARWVAVVPRSLSFCPEFIIQTSGRIGPAKPALRIPLVRLVQESPQFSKLLGKDALLREKWSATKEKLCLNAAIPGLNFKPWKAKPRMWSVKVDEGRRAHLLQVDPIEAVWQAVEIGTHTKMGHG